MYEPLTVVIKRHWDEEREEWRKGRRERGGG